MRSMYFWAFTACAGHSLSTNANAALEAPMLPPSSPLSPPGFLRQRNNTVGNESLPMATQGGFPPVIGIPTAQFSNLALHKPCMQSSSPDNASCTFALNNDSRTSSHTASESEPWFLLDLAAPHYIDSVRL